LSAYLGATSDASAAHETYAAAVDAVGRQRASTSVGAAGAVMGLGTWLWWPGAAEAVVAGPQGVGVKGTW
jgi:hypothetical protein